MRKTSFALINLAGMLAFALPFLIDPQQTADPRSSDAPWLMALIIPLLFLVGLTQALGHKLDTRTVALLGMLSGTAALMRIPFSFGGANLMFFLPIVGGAVFGPIFGFLLGSLAMGASAIVTGGIGPWLPFQMWAAGWVGLGAGALFGLFGSGQIRRISLATLALYAAFAGFFYGAVMNLYFWPVGFQGSADIAYDAAASGWENLIHFRNFYLLTSLSWDSLAAIGNATLIVLAGRPVVAVLSRYRRRFSWSLGSGDPAVRDELVSDVFDDHPSQVAI